MRRLTWVFRLVATALAAALFLTGITVAIAPRLWGIANSHDEAPIQLPGFEPLAQRSYVFDRNGAEIAVFQQENIQPFKLSQVPADVVRAVLAVEDKEFYEHKGVNVRSLIRATLSNFSSGANRQGASTITQQVVKNEFLAGLPRDGRYKLLQVHYALMLEKVLTKDEILERYLNTIFFGNNAYGLAAAAETYFGEPVEQLTLVQGAFLAGLIRSPSGYDPFRRPDRARARFEQVLDRLVVEDIIPTAERDELLRTWPIPEIAQVLPGRTDVPSYYTDALEKYLLEKSNILGADEQERRSTLLRGGLRIHTTLDPAMQAAAEYSRYALPANSQGFDAAIVSLETSTGAIRVMVGGSGFRRNISEVNMALQPRQTGSSIKMFVLAAALQAGAEPNDLIDGILPCTLPNPDDPRDPFRITQGESEPVGTLRRMTSASINCAFSRLAQIVGLHRVVDTTYRMAKSEYLYAGITKAERGADYIHPYASFATGANEMSPLDMASGAQTIANQGVHKEPYYVEYIDKADGTRFYTHDDPGVQVLDPGVALTEIDMLKGVIREGTGRRYPLNGGRPAAGKTGTQDDNTNAWFVGFTPQLTTSVWVGNPNGYIKMNDIPEFVKDGVRKVQGGTYPEKIWKAFMDAALIGQPNLDWPPPPPPARPPLRLYLPGNECVAKVISAPAPTADTTPVAEGEPAGFRRTASARPEAAPPATDPPGTQPPDAQPPSTTPGDPSTESSVEAPATTAGPVVQVLPSGTTIPPDVLDPRAPLPAVDIEGTLVFDCARGIPGATVTDDPTAAGTPGG